MQSLSATIGYGKARPEPLKTYLDAKYGTNFGHIYSMSHQNCTKVVRIPADEYNTTDCPTPKLIFY